jgi:hypothetical protein
MNYRAFAENFRNIHFFVFYLVLEKLFLQPFFASIGYKNEVSQTAPIEFPVEFGVVQDADRLDAIGAIGNSLSNFMLAMGYVHNLDRDR